MYKRQESYSKEDFLSEVYMTSEKYDSLKGLLLNKKNIILQGAPGCLLYTSKKNVILYTQLHLIISCLEEVELCLIKMI